MRRNPWHWTEWMIAGMAIGYILGGVSLAFWQAVL